MPYRWTETEDAARTLMLWPHRSLTPRGFVWFIGVTVALFAVPLFAILGSSVLWGILPFVILAVAGTWAAIARNWKDAEITEELVLSPEVADLVRRDRSGERRWSDNPYWVRVRLHETGGPVPNYVTLKGRSREVEIGAFLSEPERLALKGEIEAALANLR